MNIKTTDIGYLTTAIFCHCKSYIGWYLQQHCWVPLSIPMTVVVRCSTPYRVFHLVHHVEWDIWCGMKQIYSSKHDIFINNKIVTSMTICIYLENVSGFKMVLKYPPSEIWKNIYYWLFKGICDLIFVYCGGQTNVFMGWLEI